jgi:hypothetical protein
MLRLILDGLCDDQSPTYRLVCRNIDFAAVHIELLLRRVQAKCESRWHPRASARQGNASREHREPAQLSAVGPQAL